jgi:hypothetical protein
MAHARPFSTSTLQDLSNGIKNISRRGVLTLLQSGVATKIEMGLIFFTFIFAPNNPI